MSKQLPERPSLEFLKNEAKALKKSTGQRLSEAQLEVARDYGFRSWPHLKRHVEGYDSARDVFFAAIQAGDRARTNEILDIDPGLIHSHNPHSFGQVPISAATSRSDRPMIDLLLKRGADIDARSDWWAGSFGALDFCSPEIADYLLSKGATLTPHAAARLGMADELQRMIAANPGVVHERGGDGQYPLHFSSSPEIVDILADAGADMDARCIDHESTAAQWRAKEFDVLEALIRRGAATDIFTAVAVDEPKLVEKHLSEDPDSLLRKAAEPGNPMIHHAAPGAPIYVYVLGNLRPLQVAANLDRKKAFQFLFEKSPGPVQLMAACWMGDRSTAESLSKYLPELSAEDLSQVSDAAKARRHDLVRLMLELGFPVDAQDNEGMSPVHWAGFHGDLEGLRTILSFQPDLTLKNGYGGDALSTTCYGSANCWYPDGKYADSVRLLLDSGAPFRSDIHGTDEVNAVLKEYANR